MTGNIDVGTTLAEHLRATFQPATVEAIADDFHRLGYVKFGDPQYRGFAPLVPLALLDQVRAEVQRLLRQHAERRDLRLTTTGGTPRRMSVVKSEEIEKESELIAALARSEPLLGFLGRIAREPVIPEVSGDERFLITHQEHASDTHGWHWGDYSFALIWALRMPPLEMGGMLQCVPHTHWNKAEPRIHRTLCERQIDTHGLLTGDIYFLRTDTTLHRTVPLVADAERTILNMTWAGQRDLDKELVGEDRWWEDPEVRAAQAP